MIKRLILVLGILALPLIAGLVFTYDIVKIDWISFMEIQPSFRSQEDPLPLPARSVPIQGAAYIAELGAPANPVPADAESLARGKAAFDVSCALCHGVDGKGAGPFSAFLQNKPANLLTGKPVTDSDGAIFLTITNGVDGRMPSLIENLPTAGARWDVVNYVRSLQAASK
jgi:mono/diheme cytochrome c family protein